MDTAETYARQMGYMPKVFFKTSNNTELPDENPNLTPVRLKQSTRYGAVSTILSSPLGKRATEAFGAGGLLSSVFNLCSATLGAGCLALPFAFARCGLVYGSISLLLAAVCSIYSIRLLLRCRDATCISSYEDLSFHCFGRGMAHLVEVNIILFCFGCCVAYIVAVGDILTPVALRLWPLLDPPPDPLLLRRPIMAAFALLVMLPLSMLERISSLRFASFLGVVSIMFLVAMTCSLSLEHLATHGFDRQHTKIITGVGLGDVLSSAGVVMFAFNCQVNVFSIYTELRRPSLSRMRRVVDWSMGLCLLLYGLVGAFGYLRFGDHTLPDVLQNFDLSVPLVALGQALVGVTVTLAFPLNIFPARFALEIMFFKNRPPSRTRFYIWSVSLVLLALLLALFAPGVSAIFGLLGSTTSVILCFVLPSAFFLHIFKGPSARRGAGLLKSIPEASLLERLQAWALLIGGVVMGLACTAASFTDIAST